MGWGYVGLPLEAIGFDLDADKGGSILNGRSWIRDVCDVDAEALGNEERLVATTDFSEFAHPDTVNICVPTPLRKTKDPDMS